MIRVSGRGSWRSVATLLVTSSDGDASGASDVWRARIPQRAHFRCWEQSSGAADPPVTVPCLVLPFARDASYTGDEGVELYVPGSPPLVRRCLERLRRAGVRSAEPGEFTRRAFLNGRIDLTRAESIAELIAAEDLDALRAARRLERGELARAVEQLGDAIHDAIALLEAGLDFSEQEVEPPQPASVAALVAELAEHVERILAQPRYRPREAPRLCWVIWGRANAGKSTLLNALIGDDVSITSDGPGTTRDAVRAELARPGWPRIEFLDLPGSGDSVAATSGRVERAAIDLSRSWLDQADGVLYVEDGTRPIAARDEEWLALATELRARSIRVANKMDLPHATAGEGVRVSCRDGRGFGELDRALTEHLTRAGATARGGVLLMTDRQLGGLEDCREQLRDVERAILESGVAAPELVSVDLRLAHDCLAAITGAITTEETLDKIFSQFCLGK